MICPKIVAGRRKEDEQVRRGEGMTEIQTDGSQPSVRSQSSSPLPLVLPLVLSLIFLFLRLLSQSAISFTACSAKMAPSTTSTPSQADAPTSSKYILREATIPEQHYTWRLNAAT